MLVSATMGVGAALLSLRLIVGPSFRLGFTGKVENGPSVTDLLLGGLPLNLPEEALPLLGQAEETAGPCRRRLLLGVIAERGSLVSFHIWPRVEGVIAE